MDNSVAAAGGGNGLCRNKRGSEAKPEASHKLHTQDAGTHPPTLPLCLFLQRRFPTSPAPTPVRSTFLANPSFKPFPNLFFFLSLDCFVSLFQDFNFSLNFVFRRNSLVMELDNMTKFTNNLIDDGKNSDEFTRDVMNGCIAKNQITKGKVDAFKSLRRHLLEELEQAFPDEVESYREIRATSAAGQKRLVQAQNILPNGDVKVKPEV